MSLKYVLYNVGDCLMLLRRRFHILSAATEKARSPQLCLLLGMNSNLIAVSLPSSQALWTRALMFLISRVWFMTLVSISRTHLHVTIIASAFRLDIKPLVSFPRTLGKLSCYSKAPTFLSLATKFRKYNILFNE